MNENHLLDVLTQEGVLIGVVTQPVDIAHAGQEQVERPRRVLTVDEVIFLHQPGIDPTELGGHFPESFRIEDTFSHAMTFLNSFRAPCPECRVL